MRTFLPLLIPLKNYLESLSSRIMSFTLSDLPVLMVSTLTQFIATHVVENIHTKYWLVRNIRRTSSTRMNNTASIHHLVSLCIPSIDPVTSRDIWFWMTKSEGLYYAGIYAFIQRTICFEQIEYQLWHLSSTQISSDDIQGRKILTYNKGVNEAFSANN